MRKRTRPMWRRAGAGLRSAPRWSRVGSAVDDDGFGPWVEPLEGRRLFAAAVPTAVEQFTIELINRARANPPKFATDFGLSVPLTDATPQPPLAVNPYLTGSARGHAQEMATYGYFGHQSAVTGKWPNRMARDAGYPLPSYWEDNNNYIESIASGYGTAMNVVRAFLVDTGINPPGHRIHLLAMTDFFKQHDEIGVGYAVAPPFNYDYWAVHTAFDETPGKFLTGVAYTDAVAHDQFYTVGEGLGGVTITARRQADGATFGTTTYASGGYSLRLDPGTYDVTASGPGFASAVVASGVVVGAANVKWDVVPVVDSVPPSVTAEVHAFETLPHRLRFTFSEDVSASLESGDLTVTNRATNAPVAVTYVAFDAGTRTATFDLVGGVPADGNYRAVLSGAGVRDVANNPMAADRTFDFFVFGGDANHDRTVDFNDLVVLAQNYNSVGGGTFGGGDFDYDGDVDFNDLVILAQRYNTSLAVPAGGAAVPNRVAAGRVRASLRVFAIERDLLRSPPASDVLR